MSKNKLAKFGEMEQFENVFQCPYFHLKQLGGRHKNSGRWFEYFGNNNPIVLELGCGHGEYTVALAEMYPDKNFIGVDIKGARMWSGAKDALSKGLKNVAFLRTNIEAISGFFDKGEVSEIWITFPDPQMKKTNKRMTSAIFLSLYEKILASNAKIHLKTDSNFMFTYTKEVVRANGFKVEFMLDDLYHSDFSDDKILSIRTYYETQWLERGLTIKYIRFVFEDKDSYIEPEVDIEYDEYRSYNRSRRSGKTSSLDVVE